MATVAHDIPVQALPTKAQAARMLGVDKSRLTRREDLAVVRAGGRQHLTPETILELNREYRRAVERSLAHDLIEFAMTNAPDHGDDVRARVTTWIREHRPQQGTAAMSRDAFLRSWGVGLTKVERAALERVYDRAAGAGTIPDLSAWTPSEE